MSQPSPLLAAWQRAQALRGAGDVAGARAVLEHAVEVGRTRLGEDDPDVVRTLHELARVHQAADDPMAARRVLEEAYAAGQWRLGDADPLMLAISFDLGVVAEVLSNRHEARKAFGRVASVGAQVLGADHWAVGQALAYLGDDPQIPGQPGGPLTLSSQPPPPRPGTEGVPNGYLHQPPGADNPEGYPGRHGPSQDGLPSGYGQPGTPLPPTADHRARGYTQTPPAPGAPAEGPPHGYTRLPPAPPAEAPVSSAGDSLPHAYPGQPAPPPGMDGSRDRRGGGTGSAMEEPTVVQQTVRPRSVSPATTARPDPPVPSQRIPGSTQTTPGPAIQQPTGDVSVRQPAIDDLPAGSAVQPVHPEGPMSDTRLPTDQPAPRYFGGTGVPADPVARDTPYRRRGAAVYAAIAASLAAVIAVVALVLVLANRHSWGDDDNVPTLSGPPPTDVKLTDSGASITVTWTDPANAKTTFLVTMARPGQVMKSVGQVGPGETSFRMDGLNTGLDYCFAVVAVYSTTRFATSPQACTSRSSTR